MQSSNQYVVTTDEQIQKVVDQHITSLGGVSEAKEMYLRYLWGTAQHELGVTSGVRGKAVRIDGEGKSRELAAVAAVHERFYKLARSRVHDRCVAEGFKGKALADESNRRSNYWRTCVYAIRAYIRAGYSIASLPPQRVSKSTINVPVVAKIPTPGRLTKRVEKASKAFVAQLLALVEVDKDKAAQELDILLGQLAAQRAALGGPPSRDAKVAAAEHKPFRMGSTVFMPTATQVLRQMERPS